MRGPSGIGKARCSATGLKFWYPFQADLPGRNTGILDDHKGAERRGVGAWYSAQILSLAEMVTCAPRAVSPSSTCCSVL